MNFASMGIKFVLVVTDVDEPRFPVRMSRW